MKPILNMKIFCDAIKLVIIHKKIEKIWLSRPNMKVEFFFNFFIFMLGANIIKGVKGTKVIFFFQGLHVTCGIYMLVNFLKFHIFYI
jgi:hypothetical protein